MEECHVGWIGLNLISPFSLSIMSGMSGVEEEGAEGLARERQLLEVLITSCN